MAIANDSFRPKPATSGVAGFEPCRYYASRRFRPAAVADLHLVASGREEIDFVASLNRAWRKLRNAVLCVAERPAEQSPLPAMAGGRRAYLGAGPTSVLVGIETCRAESVDR